MTQFATWENFIMAKRNSAWGHAWDC